jgi:hypothetical protein
MADLILFGLNPTLIIFYSRVSTLRRGGIDLQSMRTIGDIDRLSQYDDQHGDSIPIACSI